METTPAEVSFQLFTDERLLDLLRGEEDRLPRPAVDEIVGRGARMILPLSEICRDVAAWNRVGPEAWAPVHSTFILGAMESERALGALLDALHESVCRNRAVVWKALPGILGALGRPGVPSLKKRVRDADTPEREKTVVIHCLAAVAARHAVEQGDVLDFMKETADNADQTDRTRGVAALVLLRFLRPGDREAILHAAAPERWKGREPLFEASDVDEAYLRGTPDVDSYRQDWLAFYGDEASQQRERRRREEAEDKVWGRGIQTREPWVYRAEGQLLGKYEGTLGDLDDVARGDAFHVAGTMTDFLIAQRRTAPWRWNASTVFSYFMHCFVREEGMDEPGRIAATPDNALRFARFCAAEGRVREETLREVEACVAEERDGFLAVADDPERRQQAREAVQRLLGQGLNPADRSAWQAAALA